MVVISNSGGVANTNCYLVGDEESGTAVLFDAPDHTLSKLLDDPRVAKLDVVGLWLTHGHFDHLADHQVATMRYPQAKVLIHRLDEPRLINPMAGMFPLPFKIPGRKADGYFEDGEVRAIGNLKLRVMHIPGHAPGHVAFYFADQKLLIGGDLIIMNSVGRTDIPGADGAELERSIRKVMQLPDDTRLLSGHGGPTTLGEERRVNQSVRAALRGG